LGACCRLALAGGGGTALVRRLRQEPGRRRYQAGQSERYSYCVLHRGSP